MASLTFDSWADDVTRGNIAMATDSFKIMLVTSTYTPNKGTHTKRSDVTNEVTGTGYSAGGVAVTVTVTKDTVNHREDFTFATVAIPTVSVTARAGVIYKSRGGLSSADELVGYVDFLTDITSTADTFTITFSAPLRLQN